MSGAPSSVHQALRQAAWRRTWDRLLREPAGHPVNDSADPRRPLGAGVRPMTHDDRTPACKQEGAVALEDGRHEPTDA